MAPPVDTATPEGRSRERYRRIFLSSAAGVAAMGVSALVGLVSVPISLAYLGKEAYGLWAVVGSVAAWVALLDPGLVQGLVIAVSEAHGRDDHEAARAYFSTAFFALLAVAGVAVAVVGLLAPFVPWGRFFEVPASMTSIGASAGFGVALALAALALPVALVGQVYAGYQRAYVGSAFTMGGALLSLALLLLATRAGAPFAAVVGASGAATVVAGVAGLAWLAGREFPWMRPSWGAVSRGALRRLLASAVPFYFFQLGALLVNQTQRPVLAHRAGLDTVADYDLLIRLYSFAVLLITASTASVAPTFRESFERGDREWVRRSFRHLVRLRMALAAGASLVLLAAGNWLVRVWVHRVDFQYDVWTWIALSVLILSAVWAGCFFELLVIMDRIWPLVAVVLAQGTITVALTWVLGARDGVLGGLLALALPGLALTNWIVPRMAEKLLSPEGTSRPTSGTPPGRGPSAPTSAA
jgi:O-antigen/teichoic acid export membrane protein